MEHCFRVGSGCQNATPTEVLSSVCWAPFPLMWCHQCVLHTTPIEVLSSVCWAPFHWCDVISVCCTPLPQRCFVSIFIILHSPKSADAKSADVIHSVLNTTYVDVLSFLFCFSCGSIFHFFEHSAGYGSFKLQSICICLQLGFVHLGRLEIPTSDLK